LPVGGVSFRRCRIVGGEVGQRYHASGSVAPSKMGGHRKRVLEPHRTFIAERINQTPQLSLHRLKEELAARGSEGIA